jgi:uncharacterized delta-60 repeat protein
MNADLQVMSVNQGKLNGSIMSTQNTSPKRPGNLDDQFGDNGVVIGPAGATTYSLASQPDGKLIYAVHSANQYLIYRTNSDGQSDPTFGNDGSGSVSGKFLEDKSNKPTRLISRDNKILIIGDALSGAEGTPAANRLNESGSPDLIFKNVLVPRPAISSNANGSDGAVLEDGRILILSQRTKDQNVGQLTCMFPNGTPDGSFGDQGHITVVLGDQINRMVSVAIQTDDKIVIGMNYITLPSGSQLVLCRYTSQGKLDKSFGTDGYTRLGPDRGTYGLNKMIAQPDGKLICVGTTGFSKAFIMRYNEDGSPDLRFNGGKEVLMEIPYGGLLSAVGVQPEDGKIVAAGWSGSPTRMFWGRLNEDGTNDSSFGDEGWVRELATGIPYDILLQDGRFIIAGEASRPTEAVLYGILR